MKNLLLCFNSILLSCCFLSNIFAQPTVKKWDKSFGNAPITDWGFIAGVRVKKTLDGNYVLAGTSTYHGQEDKSKVGQGDDAWIIKFTPDGTKLWDQTLVEPGNSSGATGFITTSDGGYLVCAPTIIGSGGDKTEEGVGIYDYWVVKLDSNGAIQWNRTIGGFGSDNPGGLQETADGGFLIAGDSESGIGGDKTDFSKGLDDYWLVKISATGQKLWDVTYGGTGTESLSSLVKTNDGGYLLAGISDSPVSGDKTAEVGDLDFWLVKVNELGVMQWEKTIGGPGQDNLHHVHPEADGGFVLAGSSRSNAGGDKSENGRGGRDGWIVKIDSLGNVLWDKTLGGTWNEAFNYVENSLDGGYLISAYSNSPAGGDKTEPVKIFVDSDYQSDFWFIKLNANHEKVWDRTIGGDGSDGMAYGTEYEPGKYFILGESGSSLWAPQDRSVQRKGQSDIWFTEFWEEQPPLPVTLTLFEATSEPGAVQLTWQTASEVNAAHFEVEHSHDAKNWARIASINARGQGAGFQTYQFTHNNVSADEHYYRLKMVDRDGTFTFSKIRHISLDGGFQMHVYPNPVTETIHLQASDWSDVKGLQILNNQGKVFYSAGNDPKQDISARSLTPGSYFIKLTLADGTETIRKIAVAQ